MDYHHHARLTMHGREALCRAVVEGRLRLCEAAAEHRLSRQTAAKWVRRFRAEGMAGLADRSSRPHRLRQPTTPELMSRVETMRRERWTGVRIAQTTGLSRATISRILTRLKLNKIRMLEPAEPVVRYEHPAAGDLVHIDIKKLARIVRAGHRITGDPRDETRGAGWEFLYVAVETTPGLPSPPCIRTKRPFPRSTSCIAPPTGFGTSASTPAACSPINGPCFYRLQFGGACRTLGIEHRRTRPYRPQTNGKAERFIQTAIREWAYARRYENSAQRLEHLQPWTHQYNWHRPHASLKQAPPISRSGLDVNNLLRHHS